MDLHDSGDGSQSRSAETEGTEAAGDNAHASSSSRSSFSCKADASPSPSPSPSPSATSGGSAAPAAPAVTALCWPTRARRTGGFVWRSDLLELLRCPRCQQAPLAPPVRLCVNGHSLCHTCYQDLSTQTDVCCNCHEEINDDICFLDWSDGECSHEECSAEPPGCVVCGEAMMEARNLLAEELCQLLSEGAQGSKGLCMRPSPSSVTLASTVSVATTGADTPNDDSSRAESVSPPMAASHRPLRCPREPCRRLVAVTALLSHFRFQHPDVPVANTLRGAATTLALLPSTVPLEMATCVALLLVHRAPCVSQGARGVMPLPVLTSRTRLLGGLPPAPTAGDADSSMGAALLVWLCDIEGGSITYSATTCRDSFGASYRGPVASLRRPQTPAAAMQSYGCLALAPGVVVALTKGGKSPALISFVVY